MNMKRMGNLATKILKTISNLIPLFLKEIFKSKMNRITTK